MGIFMGELLVYQRVCILKACVYVDILFSLCWNLKTLLKFSGV